MHTLGPVSVGIPTAEWPLHVTLAPYFMCHNGNYLDVVASIEVIARDTQPIVAKWANVALYGPNDDTPVTELDDISGELQLLHERLIFAIGAVGCEFIDQTYILNNYSPHVTHRSRNTPLNGEDIEVRLADLSIVQKLENNAVYNKLFLKHFEFGG